MEDYQGRHIGCAPGTHKALHGMIMDAAGPLSGVLDFGAHSGALLARLQDSGFSDLTGSDLDETRFDLDGAAFQKVDLNGTFTEQFDRQFSLITATDVIEHLDSPRHFLSEVRSLLTKDGWIGLSFPNVAFWEGRLKFVLKGELWGFGERNYVDQRHISPMTLEQTLLMLREIGFRPVSWGTAGSFATTLKRCVTAPIWGPLRLMGGTSTLGESMLVVAQKQEPESDLSRPIHYRNRWNGVADGVGLS